MDSAQARRAAGLAGPDDLVDGARAGRGAGAEVLGGVLVGEPPALLPGIVGGGASARRWTTPTACSAPMIPSSARRPRQVRSAPRSLRVHRDVGAAERLAQHDREARHGRLGERVQQLGAVADDARRLLVGPGQEARRVDEHDEREPERVAGARRSAAPFCEASASITPPRCRGWLATMPTGRPSMRAKAVTRFGAQSGDDLEQRAGVDDPVDRRAHVVRRAGIERDDAARVRARRVGGAAIGDRLAGVRGQVAEQLADEEDRVDVVVDHEVADAVAPVHARPTELAGADVLARDLADDRRAGEEHARGVGHDDEVRQRGRVAAAAGRGAGDHGDLRDPRPTARRARRRSGRSR